MYPNNNNNNPPPPASGQNKSEYDQYPLNQFTAHEMDQAGFDHQPLLHNNDPAGFHPPQQPGGGYPPTSPSYTLTD
ncbi:unnamed protein product [Cunninghamella echinulata]